MSIYSINYLFKNSKLNPDSLPQDFLKICNTGVEHSLTIMKKGNSIPADKKEIVINGIEILKDAFNTMHESAKTTLTNKDILLTFVIDTNNKIFKVIEKTYKDNYIEEVAERLSMYFLLGCNAQITKELISKQPFSKDLELFQKEFEKLLKNQYKPNNKLFFIEKIT